MKKRVIKKYHLKKEIKEKIKIYVFGSIGYILVMLFIELIELIQF